MAIYSVYVSRTLHVDFSVLIVRVSLFLSPIVVYLHSCASEDFRIKQRFTRHSARLHTLHVIARRHEKYRKKILEAV